MRTKIAVLLLAIALALMIKPTYEAVMFLQVDYDMHHQTGVMCFDYENDRKYSSDSTILEVEATANTRDTEVDYWRTAVPEHNEPIMGYHGYSEI